jgi:hypothetical protein
MSRESYTRITTGAPLSRHLQADAERIRELAADFARGHISEGQMVDKLRMFAGSIAQRSRMAEALEEIGQQSLGGRYG